MEKFFGKNLDPSNPNYKKFKKMQDSLAENERQLSDKNKTQDQKLAEFMGESSVK